jgi:Fur family transcriptional regulator, stress-responsive regulator
MGGRAITDLLERLREKSWRLTPQRRVVAEVLEGPNVHLTADAVHSAAQALLPEISLATVYNTLNELVAMGEVLEVGAGPGPKRYDPNAHTPHHHLVCRSCGSLHDVFFSVDVTPEIDEASRAGFTITGVEMVFQGICPQCATDPARGDDRPPGPESLGAIVN